MKNKNISSTAGGIKDSKKDLEKLKPETIVIDMPEVKDIPGQEHINVPQFREMQDITIASAGEEGEGILDDLNTEKDRIINNETNVTPLEKKLLKNSTGHPPTAETEDFNKMALDDRDNDGVLLNEKGIKQDRTGEDLDTPGAEPGNEDENISELDEENNLYSQRD